MGGNKILLVEDDSEIARLTKMYLEAEGYLVTVVDNGLNALEAIKELKPELVLLDLMLPGKNGAEICHEAREFYHGIIIVLTPTDDEMSEVSLSKFGADDYLTKPFNRTELLIRLTKLLEVRQTIQEKYRLLEPGDIDPENEEDAFIKQIREEVEGNIDDENFGIAELGRAIGMSRAQLHRKIKALTGRSTSIFIRSIRLHRAKKLLQSTDLNIAQVAFEVGFRDPKYFSRTFSALMTFR